MIDEPMSFDDPRRSVLLADIAAFRDPDFVRELAKYIAAEDISMGTGLTLEEIAEIVGDA